MEKALRLQLHDGQYRELLARYHFGENDLPLLVQLGTAAQRQIAPVLFWETVPGQERAAAVVTLGEAFDRLQESYGDRERLTESYMLECIGMELLRGAYEQTAVHLHEQTGKWPGKFEFVGGDGSFESMRELFALVRPARVSYNQAYMLQPKKTAAFYAPLCAQRRDSYRRLCADCAAVCCPSRTEPASCSDREASAGCPAREEPAADCPARGTPKPAAASGRPMPYGYQRILGQGGAGLRERRARPDRGL